MSRRREEKKSSTGAISPAPIPISAPPANEGVVAIPEDVQQTISDFTKNMSSLKDLCAQVQSLSATGPPMLNKLHEATANCLSNSVLQLDACNKDIRKAYVAAAMQEDLLRCLVLVSNRLVGLPEDDLPLKTHTAMQALKEKTHRVTRQLASARKLLSEPDADSYTLESVMALLEQLEATMEISMQRKEQIEAALETLSLASCPASPTPMASSTAEYGEREHESWTRFHPSPSRTHKPSPSRPWIRLAKSLRKQYRPVYSLIKFEDNEKLSPRGDRGSVVVSLPPEDDDAHTFPSPPPPPTTPPTPPSSFSAVLEAIEKYDVVRIVKPDPPPPPVVVRTPPPALPPPPPPPPTSPPVRSSPPATRRSTEAPTLTPTPTGREHEQRPRSGSRSLHEDLPSTIGRKNSMTDEPEARPRSNSKTLPHDSPSFAVTPGPAPKPSSSSQSYQDRVEEIYRRHNPSKLQEVPALMKKYAGREAELLDRLDKKYGTSSAQPTATTAPVSGGWGAAVSAPTASTASPAMGFGSPAPARSLFSSPMQAAAPTPTPALTPAPSGPPVSLFGTATPAAPSPFGLTPGFSVSTTPAGSLSAPPHNIEQQVHEIYRVHNPAKLGEIPQLLEKYKGRELQLLANLEKKYRGGMTAGATTSPAPAFGSPATSLFGARNASTPSATPAPTATPFGTSPGTSLFGQRPQTTWGSPSSLASPMQPSAWGQQPTAPVQGGWGQAAPQTSLFGGGGGGGGVGGGSAMGSGWGR